MRSSTDKGQNDKRPFHSGYDQMAGSHPLLRTSDLEAKLRTILLGNSWFVKVLQAVRECDPPNWVVGAGVIRNIVWDYLHGFETPTPMRDIDVAFFDPTNVSRERDRELEAELRRRLPSIPWEVTNQAGVHTWYLSKFGEVIPPILSIEDAVSRWPETATSVAVRLLSDDRLFVIAPLGLEDLFGLILRRNPKQVTAEYFRQRIRRKAIRQKWPKVVIVEG